MKASTIFLQALLSVVYGAPAFDSDGESNTVVTKDDGTVVARQNGDNHTVVRSRASDDINRGLYPTDANQSSAQDPLVNVNIQLPQTQYPQDQSLYGQGPESNAFGGSPGAPVQLPYPQGVPGYPASDDFRDYPYGPYGREFRGERRGYGSENPPPPPEGPPPPENFYPYEGAYQGLYRGYPNAYGAPGLPYGVVPPPIVPPPLPPYDPAETSQSSTATPPLATSTAPVSPSEPFTQPPVVQPNPVQPFVGYPYGYPGQAFSQLPYGYPRGYPYGINYGEAIPTPEYGFPPYSYPYGYTYGGDCGYTESSGCYAQLGNGLAGESGRCLRYLLCPWSWFADKCDEKGCSGSYGNYWQPKVVPAPCETPVYPPPIPQFIPKPIPQPLHPIVPPPPPPSFPPSPPPSRPFPPPPPQPLPCYPPMVPQYAQYNQPCYTAGSNSCGGHGGSGCYAEFGNGLAGTSGRLLRYIMCPWSLFADKCDQGGFNGCSSTNSGCAPYPYGYESGYNYGYPGY